jgi:hypothetical protein
MRGLRIRNKMIIEDIEIPLLTSSAPNEQKLLKWNVPDGTRVVQGQVLFTLCVDGVNFEVESFYSGFVKHRVFRGAICNVGDTIGKIACEELPCDRQIVGIEVLSADLAKIDERRGNRSRGEYLSEVVTSSLAKRE